MSFLTTKNGKRENAGQPGKKRERERAFDDKI